MKQLPVVLALTLALTSCASHLSKQQCQTISWKSEGYQDSVVGKMPRDLNTAIQDCAKYQLKVSADKYMQGWHTGAKAFCTPNRETGFIDGQAGRSINAINYRTPICSRAGVRLSLSKYRIGRHNGLKQYCTYENGSNLAHLGVHLPNVCPKSLNKQFRKGWMSGKKEYCNQSSNGFALGKADKRYPDICPANLYIGFKSEYDRGMLIGNQIRGGKRRISDIDSYVRSKRFRYDLESSADGFYQLGRKQSPDANAALSDVNNLVRERKSIERDIFNLQIQR